MFVKLDRNLVPCTNALQRYFTDNKNVTRQNKQGRNLVTALLLKNERKGYLPKMKDRFRFSDVGGERT